jgi:VIT1/CCC1 family predicted Fe2+/Mn2+ transporter
MQTASVFQSIKQAFQDSIGDIIFGMEDGTVSIFGLVFGVAASTSDSQTIRLAGTTGAIAAAVSMMAGTYLDATPTRSKARSRIAHERNEIVQHPSQGAAEALARLEAAGFTPAEADGVARVLERHPSTSLQF